MSSPAVPVTKPFNGDHNNNNNSEPMKEGGHNDGEIALEPIVVDAVPIVEANYHNNNNNDNENNDELARLRAENERLQQQQQQQGKIPGYNNNNNDHDDANGKPWYCRWYSFTVLVVIVAIVVIAASVAGGGGDSGNDDERPPPTLPDNPNAAAKLTVDLTGLPEMFVSVRIFRTTDIEEEDTTTTAADDVLLETYTRQGGQERVYNVPYATSLKLQITEYAAVLEVADIDCSSGECNAGPVTQELAVDLEGLFQAVDVTLLVETSSSTPNPLEEVRTVYDIGGRMQNITVLALEQPYTVQVNEGLAVQTFNSIDCSASSNACIVPTVVATMVLDLQGLPENMRVELFALPTTASSQQRSRIRAYSNQGGVVQEYKVLNVDNYNVDLVRRSIRMTAPGPVDCTAAQDNRCVLDNLTSVLTVDARNIAQDCDVRVRNQAINSEFDGADSVGGTIQSFTVFRSQEPDNEPYTVIINESFAKKEVEVDCSSGNCAVSAETIGTSLTVDMSILRDSINLDWGVIDTSDGDRIFLDSQTDAGGAVRTIPALTLDNCFIRLTDSSHRVYFEGIDCLTGTCTAPAVGCTLRIVDLDPAIVSRFDIQAPSGTAGVVGPRIVRFSEDYSTNTLEYGVICGNGYSVYLYRSSEPSEQLVSDIDCPCGGVGTVSAIV